MNLMAGSTDGRLYKTVGETSEPDRTKYLDSREMRLEERETDLDASSRKAYAIRFRDE